MDAFHCQHCGHRNDLHSEHTRRLTVVEQEAFGVLWGPEVRKCHCTGCSCTYAAVPDTAPIGLDGYLLIRPAGEDDQQHHLDLERWEAELA
jgi:hypothetical protein